MSSDVLQDRRTRAAQRAAQEFERALSRESRVSSSEFLHPPGLGVGLVLKNLWERRANALARWISELLSVLNYFRDLWFGETRGSKSMGGRDRAGLLFSFNNPWF